MEMAEESFGLRKETYTMQTVLNYKAIDRTLRIVVTLILALLAILYIFPLLWMISSAFKFEIDVLEFPIRLIPKRVNLNNFTIIFTDREFIQYYINSIKVTSISIIGNLTFASLAGYAFARLRFKGRDAIFLIYIAMMMIPIQVTILPKYLIFSNLGLTNTHYALILPEMFSVFTTFLLRQNFIGIPYEFNEAGLIDGASQTQIFTNLILPLAKPGIMTATILSFTWIWNDYLNPLVFLSSTNKLTLTVGLHRFQESFSSNNALIMAGATISLIPVILVFVSLQKYFIESFASSGIKG